MHEVLEDDTNNENDELLYGDVEYLNNEQTIEMDARIPERPRGTKKKEAPNKRLQQKNKEMYNSKCIYIMYSTVCNVYTK